MFSAQFTLLFFVLFVLFHMVDFTYTVLQYLEHDFSMSSLVGCMGTRCQSKKQYAEKIILDLEDNFLFFLDLDLELAAKQRIDACSILC